jgi:hypothetical protein
MQARHPPFAKVKTAIAGDTPLTATSETAIADDTPSTAASETAIAEPDVTTAGTNIANAESTPALLTTKSRLQSRNPSLQTGKRTDRSVFGPIGPFLILRQVHVEPNSLKDLNDGNSAPLANRVLY